MSTPDAPVPDGELTAFGRNPPTPGLTRLRLEAESRTRADDWAGLLDLLGPLRGDRECWPGLWAPLLAYAARQESDPRAVGLLTEALDGGYRSGDVGFELIESAFGADPAWPALLERLKAPPPPPGVELVTWPAAPAMLPLTLDHQPDGREDELRDRLPRRQPPDAWGTAVRLLRWASKSWAHANDHVHRADALEVLDRAARGERFACVEYSIVLTQALNAVRIPARRAQLLRPDSHVGQGKGHVVSEAWIDGLDRWVLLDGQNGAWWVDEDDVPLGLMDLLRRYREGRPALLVDQGGPLPDESRSWWFGHFAAAGTTGLTFAPDTFTPVFQETGVTHTSRLVRDPHLVEPDLAAVDTGVGDVDGVPAVLLTPVHPYATGVVVVREGEVTGLAGRTAALRLDGGAGRHELTVATSTPYGVLRAHDLVYVVR